MFTVSGNALRLAWERLRRRAGVLELRFHDLRHEAVSRFFEKGLNVPEVAMISGHRDLRMLFRYTHPKPEEVAAKLSTGTTEPRSIVMLYFRYARLKNCAETLISFRCWPPAISVSNRDGLFARSSAQRSRHKCFPPKVHLSTTFFNAIWTASKFHPMEEARENRRSRIVPQASRTLSLEATGHQLASE